MDVARNFHDKCQVMEILHEMASYKLNRLHLHLTDDEGWRVEIPGLPELTSVTYFQTCMYSKNGTSCDIFQIVKFKLTNLI